VSSASVTTPPPPAVDLRLLGGFALHDGAREVPAAPASQRLLAYLAVHDGTVPRTLVARTLWPDAGEGAAGANLRSALWRLPRPPRCPVPLVDHHPRGLAVAPAVRVDTRRLDAPPGARPDTLPTVDQLTQDLLPDWHEDWLLAVREWVRQQRLRALERMAAAHCHAGRFDDALHAAMAAVACEPLRESAHRAVTAIHLADGNSAEALRHYETYRRHLRTELGIAPSPRFRDMLAPLLSRPLDD
jgi:DNA-binding SARP family transcriptional activator